MNTSTASRLPLIALFVLVALLSLALGVWLSQRSAPPANQIVQVPGLEATMLPDGRPLGEFQLRDHDGAIFTPERLRGQWSFLFFGFTNCPDVCPMTLQLMRGVVNQLAEQTPPQVVFVSVDPERDRPEMLKQYVGYFHPDFLGVTGEITEIDRLTRQVGILYGYEDPDPETGDYMVNHSAQILLIDPQGTLRAVFSTPHEVGTIARDFQKIRSLYEG